VSFNGGTSNDRGANTAAEFERQRAKIINAITTISPDVLGLTEVSTACHASRVDRPAMLGIHCF
jgi:predicted extracellular nuclease